MKSGIATFLAGAMAMFGDDTLRPISSNGGICVKPPKSKVFDFTDEQRKKYESCKTRKQRRSCLKRWGML